MNRYARKFIIFPIIPAQLYLTCQMLPNGAAMLVTKEIIAKMKHIVIMATSLPFLLVVVVLVILF